MNIYDAILRDYPLRAYKINTTPASSYTNLMGDGVNLSTPTRSRTNLITNPSFETNTTDWGAARGTITRTGASGAFIGANVLRYTADGTAGSNYVHTNVTRAPVTAGQQYTTSAYLRSLVGGTRSFTARIVWHDAAGAVISSSISTNTSVTTAWTRLSMTATAPANATTAYVQYTCGTQMANGDIFEIDAVMLEMAVAVRDYFDGATTNTPGRTTAWTSTANNSTSTETFNAPLVTPTLASSPSTNTALQLGDGNYATYLLSERFNPAANGLPFSLESWVNIDPPNGIGQTIATHLSSVDGLYFDGDYINFRIDLADGSNVTCSWAVPDFMKIYHVVGTYNGSKICLYIDGVLVASADIPDGAVFATKSNNNLYIGLSSAAPFLRVDGIAAYGKELQAADVAAHYQAGRWYLPTSAAVAPYSGITFRFDDEGRNLIYNRDIDWPSDGIASSTIPGDYLRPVYDPATDLSISGTYTFIVPVSDQTLVTTIGGMKLEWNGDGNFVVEYSLNDGSTWLPATNGLLQASTPGISTAITPRIRITFPAGRAKNLDVVRDFRVVVYGDSIVPADNNSERTATLFNLTTTSTVWRDPIEADSASGTNMTNVNYGIINESLEVELPTTVAAIGFWVEFTGNISGAYLFDSRSVTPSDASYMWFSPGNLLAGWGGLSAVYVNGVAINVNTWAPVVGRQYHIVCVYTTPHNAKISLTAGTANNVKNLNLVTLYPAAPTAAQVLALYNSFNNVPFLAVEDPNVVIVSETAPASKAYVNDWSITGAG